MNNLKNLYVICEGTMGFSPDNYQFSSEEEAVKAIKEIADSYRQDTLVHRRLYPTYKSSLNIDENAWKYSERWEITCDENGLFKCLFINRLHFANGTSKVTVEDYPRYGNYKY